MLEMKVQSVCPHGLPCSHRKVAAFSPDRVTKPAVAREHCNSRPAAERQGKASQTQIQNPDPPTLTAVVPKPGAIALGICYMMTLLGSVCILLSSSQLIPPL